MKQILTLVMMLVVAIGAQAQVDDMYFVPKKKKAKTVEEDTSYSFETTQERVTLPERDTDEYIVVAVWLIPLMTTMRSIAARSTPRMLRIPSIATLHVLYVSIIRIG